MNNCMFIPQKIKVGFQERDNTYTKLLAYVIYFDEKGKLRKEKSWNGWRDKSIDPIEYDNSPTSGFVLNKNVGGYSCRWGDFRQSYVRVYDPRGFEFEITVPNLLYILEITSSIKGKGLEGEFVYAWDGTELILLPTDSPDYLELEQLNEKRFMNKKIKVKDLKIGAQYLTKDNEIYVYMGKFDAYTHGYKFDDRWFPTYRQMQKYANEKDKAISVIDRTSQYPYYQRNHKLYTYEVGNAGKQYFFCVLNEKSTTFLHFTSISGKLIDIVDDNPILTYTELFEKLEHNPKYSPYDKTKDVVRLLTPEEIESRVQPDSNPYGRSFLTQRDDNIISYSIYRNDSKMYYVNLSRRDAVCLSLADFGFQVNKNKLGCEAMVPTTLDEIITKMPPCCVEQFLENGKYYNTMYY